MWPSRWTDHLDRELRSLWGKIRTQEIADRLGTTKGSVIGRAYRLGLPRLKTRNVGNEIEIKVAKLYRDGQSLKEIAALTGISPGTVRNILIRRSIRTRKQGNGM